MFVIDEQVTGPRESPGNPPGESLDRGITNGGVTVFQCVISRDSANFGTNRQRVLEINQESMSDVVLPRN